MPQTTEQELTIDGYTYRVHMVPPRQSAKALIAVAKVVAPSIGAVIDGIASDGKSAEEILTSDLGEGAFFRAATSLGERLDSSIFDQLIELFGTYTYLDGKRLRDVMDAHFLGRVDAMFRWLAGCMRIQWGPTWAGLLGQLGAVRGVVGQMPQQSQAQNT